MAELLINGKDVGTMTPVGDQGALQLTIQVSGAAITRSLGQAWRVTERLSMVVPSTSQ